MNAFTVFGIGCSTRRRLTTVSAIALDGVAAFVLAVQSELAVITVVSPSEPGTFAKPAAAAA